MNALRCQARHPLTYSFTHTSPPHLCITLMLIWRRGLRHRQVNSHCLPSPFCSKMSPPPTTALTLETQKAQRKKAPGQGTSPGPTPTLNILVSAHLNTHPPALDTGWLWLPIPQCPPTPPPPQPTSFQASYPKSPKHLYQNQLRVCADLFLIAGAWFTLAPPPQY